MSDRAAHPTLQDLKRECHRLLEVISHRPGAAKLMIGVHKQLQLFSQYKANRQKSTYER